jgi:hypothetical protein
MEGMSMEKRLSALETVWQASPQAVEQASWDIQWAIQFPRYDDPTVRAARIRAARGLDDAGLAQAITLALTRCGMPRGEAERLAGVGLEQLVTMAANDEEFA